jgi:hypothetical protein
LKLETNGIKKGEKIKSPKNWNCNLKKPPTIPHMHKVEGVIPI